MPLAHLPPFAALSSRLRSLLARRSVGAKIRLLRAVAVSTLLVVLALTVGLGTVNQRRWSEIERDLYPALQLDRTLRESLSRINTALQSAVRENDPHFVAIADSLYTVAQKRAARFRGDHPGSDSVVNSVFLPYEGHYLLARRVSSTIITNPAKPLPQEVERVQASHRVTSAFLDKRMVADERFIQASFARTYEFQVNTWVFIAAVIAIGATLFGLVAAGTERSITEPLAHAVRAADRLAVGDMRVSIPTPPQDEVGHLLRSMASMVAYLNDMSAAAERIAAGDLTAGVSPRSPVDRFGNAFDGMLRYLREMAGVAEQLSSGDLTVRVGERSPHDAFGRALSHTLQRMSDTIALHKQSEDRLRLLLETATDMIVTTDLSGRVSDANAAAVQMLGRDLKDIIGAPVSRFVEPDDLSLLQEGPGTTGSLSARVLEIRVRPADGSVRWMSCAIAPIREGSSVTGVLSILRDITEDRTAEASLRASEARFRGVVDSAAIGICIARDSGDIVEANAALQALLGFTADELRGRGLVSFCEPGEAPALLAPLDDLREGRLDVASIEQRFIKHDGDVVWAHMTVSRVMLGEDSCLIAMIQDVTRRKELEAELVFQAMHDPLTGLPNRAFFRARVVSALARDGGRSEVAVLFLDLDNFKTINDSLGHAAGDHLLREVASRLLHATRGCDIAARLGGDEFAIIVDRVGADADVERVAQRILHALEVPVATGGKLVHIGVSIGIARSPEGGAGDADALLLSADTAMYEAKHRGKGRFVFFAPEMHQAILGRLELEEDLRVALDEGCEQSQLRLEYQPIVELESGQVQGVEALLRWDHPRRGPLPPDLFIPIAEESGLINQLGLWVLQRACHQAARWNAMADPSAPLSMSVNVSGKQLRNEDFKTEVANALRDSGLPADLLVLEITESVLMHDRELSLERLRELKALGTQLAIDDFGTGYSSLSYLQRFPVDILKVDRSFVDGVARGGHDAALVRTIVALCETVSLRCVAEGIEHREQHAHLQALGCQYGQGYLFARPLRPEALEELLQLTARAPLAQPQRQEA
ncbi:MAG: EAL domain-containing protein [Gemmatimonadaceae bacterium]